MKVSSEVLLLCTVIILYVSVALKPCRRACRPSSFMVSSCRRACSTIVLCISSGTNYLWPHPLHFSFLLLFLFVSHNQDSFSKTHNHLCSCSYHPDILTCVSSVVLLNVHTWINVCCFSSFFDAWVNYIVCFAENTEQIWTCVQTGEMC